MLNNLSTRRCKFKYNESNANLDKNTLTIFLAFLFLFSLKCFHATIFNSIEKENQFVLDQNHDHHKSHGRRVSIGHTCHLMPSKDQVFFFTEQSNIYFNKFKSCI